MLNELDFWKQTKKEGDCLIWIGLTNKEPVYGIFGVMGGRLIAHRVAYELKVGKLPSHSHVGRTCGNPLCVEPKHLYLQNASKSAEPLLDAQRKLESNIDKDGCWTWRGSAPKSIVIPGGLKVLARAVYELYHEPVPRGKDVSRSCQNDECINPEHLILIDKAELGKSNSKLTAEQVQDIRKLAHSGKMGLLEMADIYHTSRQTIYTVVYNLGWYDPDYIPPEKMPRRPRFCRKGHPLSGENLVELDSGVRKCKICLEAVKATKKPQKSLEERFWEKVQKVNDGCWDWTAYSHKGWGYFNIDRTPHLAHRVAYELANGFIPEGARVMHSCNNDLCCRPEHLYLEERMAAK